jgi:hypothetical protein
MQNKLSLLLCMSGHLKKVVISSCFLFVLLIYTIANGILAANGVSIDGSETSNPFYQSGDGAVVIDSTITISGIESLSSAKVQITNNFRGSEDELIFKNQNGISGNYDAGKGILSLSGIATVEKYEAALRSVRYNNKNTSKTINSNPRTFLFSVGEKAHYNSDTGHFYEYVSAIGISWQDAKASAESKSLYGIQGYLATITSAQENQFITDKLSWSGWIGASDAEVEGQWKWVTGPESGTLFTKIDKECSYNGESWFCYTTKINHTGYQNWEAGQPFDFGGDEDYGHLNPIGRWHASHNQYRSIQGYLVEYGGMSGDSQIKLTHVATMAIIPDKVAPTATVAYSNVNPTNLKVVATITPSEEVTITNNGGSASYTFVENGSFTFEFVDKAGNVGSVNATVTNIDKVAPTATVAYSNVNPTKQDVVATITPSEEVTITNNGGSTSYTFVENGSFTFEFVDKAGNVGSVDATVTNIDKVAPTATVAYSNVNPTNQDVVATITPSEEVRITNNGGSTSYTFVENDSFTFEFVDKAGNVGSVDATVTNIDKVAPTATITYSKVDPTNQDVVATLNPSEDVAITNNEGSTSYMFVENGNFTFEFVDAAGNVGSVDATVTNIDKVAPTATITYSKVDPTNQDVVATLIPSEDVAITNNEGSTSYTFVENGNFTFEFVDAAGNVGSVDATVTNIDKVAPTATIAYSKVDPTNQDVVATLNPSEDVTITNNEGSTSYTFVENGSFTFEFVDKAGNVGSVDATVTNIDKVAPTATIAYSKVDPTNQDVVATLNPSEDVTITNNEGSTSYTFVENGNFTFEFVDTAGNVGSVDATVTNIDKVAPTATIAYSKVDPTNQDVVATITPSEEVTITNNGGSTSYTFVENGSFTFEFVDKAGNVGSVDATVTNIDKVAPTATIAYSKVDSTNQDVVATLTPSEAVTILNNEGSTSYTFVENGSFTFEFVDAAGNIGTAVAGVSNIDKIAPVTKDNAPQGWVNSEVTFTFTASDNQSGVDKTYYIINGEDQREGNTVSIGIEGTHTVTYWSVDKAGNVEESQTTTIRIDKSAPILNVVLDTPILWSTNHKLVTINAKVTVNDSMSDVDSIVLTSITSNEADSGLDKDDQPNDIQDADYGTFDTVFKLRSERSGKGTGRIYTVTYTATDKAGNQTTISVTVEVPHDKGKK